MSDRERAMHAALDMILSSQRFIETLETAARDKPDMSDEIAVVIKAEKQIIELYGKELQI